MEIDVVQRIQKKRLGYFGHVVRMKTERLPNVALFGHVHGARRRGRPKKRWFNNLEEDLKKIKLNIVEASRLAASDRNRWRDSVLGLSERKALQPNYAPSENNQLPASDSRLQRLSEQYDCLSLDCTDSVLGIAVNGALQESLPQNVA
ncbi:unnamed protein product [Leuciscus chuanchicus]